MRVVMLTLLVPCTGGVTGVLAAPFVIGAGGVFDAEASVTAMHQVWSQLVGLLVITAWAASVSSLIFFTLNLNNKLRLPREVELAGCDVIKHGEAAYPAEAYTQAEAIITSTIQTETTSYNQVECRMLHSCCCYHLHFFLSGPLCGDFQSSNKYEIVRIR